jgi:hypothetical protein
MRHEVIQRARLSDGFDLIVLRLRRAGLCRVPCAGCRRRRGMFSGRWLGFASHRAHGRLAGCRKLRVVFKQALQGFLASRLNAGAMRHEVRAARGADRITLGLRRFLCRDWIER